jgi:hypothetical protein
VWKTGEARASITGIRSRSAVVPLIKTGLGKVLKWKKLNMQTDIEALFIGIGHFAKKFDVSPRTVHRRIADGTLPSLKFGRRRLIALQKLLKSQRDEANTGGPFVARS